MEPNPQKWERSLIRGALKKYGDANDENYFINNKRMIDVRDGFKAFGLLNPPLKSPAAKRRVRFIVRNVVDSRTVVNQDGTTVWGSRTPHFLTVAVTYKCQCDCAHCSAYTYRQKLAKDDGALSLEEYKEAIKQAIELGSTCVVFSGGEPLLYDGLYELIASVDRDKSVTSMFTNGEYLNDKNVKRLKSAGLFGLFVSFDSTEPKEHNANRKREGLFHKAIEGIKRCQDKGILTGISTYITREKMQNGELDSMMNFAQELGVLEVFLFDMIATGRLINERHRMLTRLEIDEIRAFQRRYNETTDYPRVIHQTMFTSIAYPCAAAGCPAGVAQMHIRGNGDVAPCDFTPYSFGNIRNESVEQIWRRITESPAFSTGSNTCRLADPAYWERLAATVTAI
jgi:MoaA/NifB/PqqE/SkfB family radical SAM enzyme